MPWTELLFFPERAEHYNEEKRVFKCREVGPEGTSNIVLEKSLSLILQSLRLQTKPLIPVTPEIALKKDVELKRF